MATTSRSSSNSNGNMECRPPVGKTYLTIGQDLFSIRQYLDGQYNASLHRNSSDPVTAVFPAAAMVYTDIYSLRGLDTPVDYGSGIEYADGLMNSVLNPSVGLQIGLWLNGSQGCRDMINGALDDKIHDLMQYLKHTKASQVFLRVGYEFDNPFFGYLDDPVAYRQAFRMLKEACLYKKWDCPAKVKFVWHSWGQSMSARNLTDFYPGDDAVDWVGISIFEQVYDQAVMPYVYDVLRYAMNRNKQIMIAESTPFGGIVSWEDWFQPTLQLIERYDISMWSYINCNWDVQPMWNYSGFGDTRLSINDDVMQHWHDQVLASERFLGAGSLNIYCKAPVRRKSHKHAKRPRHSVSSQSHQYTATQQLAVIAFFIFWVILGLWVFQRRNRRHSSLDELSAPLQGLRNSVEAARSSTSTRSHYSYGATAPEVYIS